MSSPRKNVRIDARFNCEGGDRRALTAVELLAATALAAMLMVAVLGVLQSITRGQKALLQKSPSAPWQARLAERLEWDLANSRSIRTSDEEVYLEGFAGRHFAHGTPLHCPTLVCYKVLETDGRSYLVRQETHLDALHSENHTIDIVACDVEQMVWLNASGGAMADEERSSSTDGGLADGPLPARVGVVLYAEDEAEPVFRHAFTPH